MKAVRTFALMLLIPGAVAAAGTPGVRAPACRGAVADARARVPNLNGIWYLSGDEDNLCEVKHKRGTNRAVFVNENGDRATGVIRGDRIWIRSWGDPRTGLQGEVRGDRIRWSNGTYWAR